MSLRSSALPLMCVGLLIGGSRVEAQRPGTNPDPPNRKIKTITDLGVVGQTPPANEPSPDAPVLTEELPPPPFSPFWAGPLGPITYPYAPVYPVGHTHLGAGERRLAYRLGRATERYRQDAWELRRKLAERRGPAPSGEPGCRHEGPHSPDSRWLGGYGYTLVPGYYELGRELEYYRQQELYLREQLTLAAYEDLLSMGISYFREGGYGLAARALVAAAEKNHEDAGCRVLACQALVATGTYKKALAHFRRAVELQPLLLHLPIDLRDEYGLGLKKDYDEHVARLADYCQAHPNNADAWLLLACQRFFSSDPADAGPALRRARKLAPRDPLARRLWTSAEPILDEVD